MSLRRVIVAAILSPLTIPVSYFVLNMAFSGYVSAGEGHFGKLLSATLGSVLPLSYLFAMCGIPLFALLKKYEWLTLRHCLLGSSCLGALIGYVFAVSVVGAQAQGVTTVVKLAFMLVGVVGALMVASTFYGLSGACSNTAEQGQPVRRDKAAKDWR